MPANDKPEDKKVDDKKADVKMSTDDILASLKPVRYVSDATRLSETIPGGAVWVNGFLVDHEGNELTPDDRTALAGLVQSRKGS